MNDLELWSCKKLLEREEVVGVDFFCGKGKGGLSEE